MKSIQLKTTEKGNSFEILNDMSDYVTLVQFIDNPDSLSHYINISDLWIFDYNYKMVIPLVRHPLDMIYE